MPFNIFADEGLAEEVFERTKNVYSGHSAEMFGKKSKLVKCFHLHI